MDSSIPTFDDIFIKAMTTSSAPYPDFTANYEMSLAAIFADFPEKPEDFDQVTQILAKTAKAIFDATDSSALIHGVEIYRKIADRCFSCIKGLTDNLNLGAHEIKDCWTRASRFEQEADEKGRKLQMAERTLDHQVKHISTITKACVTQKEMLEECMSEREHGKDNYRWLTELRDLYTKLEADHKHCEERFQAFGGMLKDNEELKKEVQELKIENARLTVENYTHETAADLRKKSTNLNSMESHPKAYSINVDFPGHLSIVESVGPTGSVEALLSMTIGLKRKDTKFPGQDKSRRRWKHGKNSNSFQVSNEALGVHGEVSEADSRSAEDAAGISRKMSRALKPLPPTSEKVPNLRRAIPKKKLRERRETSEDSSKEDGPSGKFITSVVAESRCVVLTNFPQGTKASELCQIIRGGRLEQILLEVHFGKPIALVYFFHEKHALAFHEWVQKPPRLTINNLPVDSKLLEVRKAAGVSVVEESRVVRVPLNPGVSRSEVVREFSRLAPKLQITPTSLQSVEIVETPDGMSWAEYAFDGRIDAKKFLKGIMTGREHMKGPIYGKDQCEEPLHQGAKAKSWHFGANQAVNQEAAKE
ncbi:hypothetical protein C7212DRAFT_344650 [Tuber magnatum]|uniref:Uncharacterized protein n=1 Tax=Tuber magnatum TaxID=42249 RepID=A0A317SN12_9PEZI|nr:hypothetical protein C7212DRAFT_344650 [Tuber magnatum]